MEITLLILCNTCSSPMETLKDITLNCHSMDSGEWQFDFFCKMYPTHVLGGPQNRVCIFSMKNYTQYLYCNKYSLEWALCNMRVLENTTLRTQCAFMGLGTKGKLEYDKFVGESKKHVVFIDRPNVREMNVIAGTQQIYQVQCEKNICSNNK